MSRVPGAVPWGAVILCGVIGFLIATGVSAWLHATNVLGDGKERASAAIMIWVVAIVMPVCLAAGMQDFVALMWNDVYRDRRAGVLGLVGALGAVYPLAGRFIASLFNPGAAPFEAGDLVLVFVFGLPLLLAARAALSGPASGAGPIRTGRVLQTRGRVTRAAYLFAGPDGYTGEPLRELPAGAELEAVDGAVHLDEVEQKIIKVRDGAGGAAWIRLASTDFKEA